MELPWYFDSGHCQQFRSIGPTIVLTFIHKTIITLVFNATIHFFLSDAICANWFFSLIHDLVGWSMALIGWIEVHHFL